MPRIGWLVNGRKTPLDEARAYAEIHGSWNNYTVAHLDALQRQTQRVDGWWLTPSSATGCKRHQILRVTEDYFVKPEKVWASLVGTSLHRQMESKGKGEAIEEVTLWIPLSVPVNGTDVMIPLVGTPDRYEPDRLRLIDYKFPGSFSYMMWEPSLGKKVTKQKELPQPEHVAQVNLYALLLTSNGMPTREAKLAYMQVEKGGRRKLIDVELWDFDDAVDYAVGAAHDIAVARETHRLPPCRCKRREDGRLLYGLTEDRDLCATTDDDAWAEEERWRYVPDFKPQR